MTDYLNSKKKYSEIYKNFSDSHCKALGIDVIYNSKGFNHIIYKSGNQERSRKDQIKRFENLELAKDLIEHTNTYQEYEFIQAKDAYYWGLVAIYKGNKLKIIIKRNGENGKYYFYSVIPNFITSPKRDK